MKLIASIFSLASLLFANTAFAGPLTPAQQRVVRNQIKAELTKGESVRKIQFSGPHQGLIAAFVVTKTKGQLKAARFNIIPIIDEGQTTPAMRFMVVQPQ